VSPDGHGDNPFVTIEPGDSIDYTIAVPADHSAGTYWYHPHHHGMVADQIFGGLAGALLVDNGPDLSVTETPPSTAAGAKHRYPSVPPPTRGGVRWELGRIQRPTRWRRGRLWTDEAP
jgi:FtsP/CotA-like multicopper oxidase with cupredoxin domain